MNRPRSLVVAALLLAACSSPSTPDGGRDAGADSGVPDSGEPDSGSLDAGGPDGGADGGVDAGVDGGGLDGSIDAGTDAGAPDGSVDAGSDAGVDGTQCVMGNSLYGVWCGGLCVDTAVDSLNCGACNAPCASGSFCDPGPLQVEHPTCVPIQPCDPLNSGAHCQLDMHHDGLCCDGSCVDPDSDTAHCGGCGQQCPAGQICEIYGSFTGRCLLPDAGFGPACQSLAGACPAGTGCFDKLCLGACAAGASGDACLFGPSHPGTCCGGECVDLSEDPNDCGKCGTTCGSGLCFTSFSSADGVCLPSGAPTCFACGPQQTCVGNSCLPNTCQGPVGACALGADAGAGACCTHDYGFSWDCRDLLIDPANCGGCENFCPTGQSCVNGQCSGAQAPCFSGTISGYCDLDGGVDGGIGVCCPGRGCIDVSADIDNCGNCDVRCLAPDAGCFAGQCGT